MTKINGLDWTHKGFKKSKYTYINRFMVLWKLIIIITMLNIQILVLEWVLFLNMIWFSYLSLKGIYSFLMASLATCRTRHIIDEIRTAFLIDRDLNTLLLISLMTLSTKFMFRCQTKNRYWLLSG